MSLSTRVLLPVPGGPVTPRTKTRPGGRRAARTLEALSGSPSMTVIALASARLSPVATWLSSLRVSMAPRHRHGPHFYPEGEVYLDGIRQHAGLAEGRQRRILEEES